MADLSVGEIFRLIGAGLLIPAFFFGIYVATKKFPFWNKIPKRKILKPLIISSAIIGFTVFIFWLGVDFKQIYDGTEIVGRYGGATAIPVISALVFGWPVGIITGFFAALFRLFAYPFGAGDYLRTAECIGVLLSGLIGAALSKTLFDNKKPKWGYGFIIGILIETVHMILVFITGMVNRNVKYAYGVIRQCDIPCAAIVVPAIMITLFIIALYEKESVRFGIRDNKIASKVQKWMLISFGIAIASASLLTYFTVSTESSVETHTTLMNAARDAVYELETAEWGEDDTYWSKKEILSLAYTRRVRDLGYVVITGVQDDATPYQFYDPEIPGLNGDIEQDKIYSTAALMQPYVDNGEFGVFYDKKHNQVKLPAMTDNLTLRVADFLGDHDKTQIPQFLKWNDHPCTPMFTAYVLDKYDDKGNERDHPFYVNVVGVIVQATVVDVTDNSVAQRFNVTALLTMEEAQSSMGMSLRIAIYIELLVFTAVYGVIYTFIKHAVVSNIQRINSSLQQITEGNLNVKVDVRSNEEFASLSDDINETVDTLKGYINEAKHRVEKELEFAKTIQKGTLPYIFPTTYNYDLFADMRTARQVGGDFYDFFPLNNNRLFFLIADVSGKGIPAAMFMMRAETLIKSLVQTDELELDQVMSAVNDELCTKNEAQMFVTCWCAILDVKNGHVDFVNAGHNRPLIKRKGGNYEELVTQKNFVLAGMEDVAFKKESFDLNPGDEILIYTDGVTEATNKNEELYGVDRLVDFVNHTTYSTSRELIDKINDNLDEFQKDVEQADDITMLMIRYKPKG